MEGVCFMFVFWCNYFNAKRGRRLHPPPKTPTSTSASRGLSSHQYRLELTDLGLLKAPGDVIS
nr:MAG TPA: hypothetical protein [Caudoviricetes sp.]